MQAFDCLVVGSGIAGLSAALHAAQWGKVAVLCKAAVAHTNTSLAQGGLAAVMAPNDSPEQHMGDTLAAGSHINLPAMVELLAREAPQCIADLSRLGVPFDTAPNGQMALGLEGGHRQHRIVHAHDQTGWHIQQALLKAVQQHSNILLLEHQQVIDLLIDEQAGKRSCAGIKVLDVRNRQLLTYRAPATILATGGAGQLYPHTTNPLVATGDGIAMALRAGVGVADMEFIQFHPTALYDPAPSPDKPVFLISEAVRGFGAELVLPSGEAFMWAYHPQASLAPRDVVAQAMQREMQCRQLPHLCLDLRKLDGTAFSQKFPAIYQKLVERGIHPQTDLVPVVPAAHYLCGGIKTDLQARTSLLGLYACGECACTGLHGANRLASNSLPEGWIMGRRAAENAKSLKAKATSSGAAEPLQEIIACAETDILVQLLRRQLQEGMWQYVGIVRSFQGLQSCAKLIQLVQAEVADALRLGLNPALLELHNLATVAAAVVQAALNRPQSCGSHQLRSWAEDATGEYKAKLLVET